jgi:hypothetical protein
MATPDSRAAAHSRKPRRHHVGVDELTRSAAVGVLEVAPDRAGGQELTDELAAAEVVAALEVCGQVVEVVHASHDPGAPRKESPRVAAIPFSRRSRVLGSPLAGENADDRRVEVEGFDVGVREAGLVEQRVDLLSGLGRCLFRGAGTAGLCGDGDASARPEHGA